MTQNERKEQTTMNAKERFWKFIRFEEVDQVPFWSDWLGPLDSWEKEGLPVDREEVERKGEKQWFVDFFGCEGMYSAFWGTHRVPVNLGICPSFKIKIIEETGDYRVYRQGDGVVVKQFKDDTGSLHSTQFMEYPIKDRDDWENFRREHLDPGAEGRYPDTEEWQKLKEKWSDRDSVISIDGGSFYGYLRDWVGVDNLSLMFYDDPDLIKEMMDYLADLFIEVLEKAVTEMDIDFAMFWEDMCYKTGPLISPDMFAKFMLPNYQKVTSFLQKHGVELSWVDCDGNIEELIPLWLEGGVRGFYPLEVAADMDAVKLRKEYGQKIVMWGNVDKRKLARGKQAIDKEIKRLAPVVKEGGFIPLVDHGVPDDVPYKNYLYYLEQRRHLSKNINDV